MNDIIQANEIWNNNNWINEAVAFGHKLSYITIAHNSEIIDLHILYYKHNISFESKLFKARVLNAFCKSKQNNFWFFY